MAELRKETSLVRSIEREAATEGDCPRAKELRKEDSLPKVNPAMMCVVCSEEVKDTKDGVTCTCGHVLCNSCLSQFITLSWDVAKLLQEPGLPEVRCVVPKCQSDPFKEITIARRVSEEALTLYLDVRQRHRDAATYANAQKIVTEANQNLGKRIESEAQRLLLQEQLKRQFPQAVQCPKCKYGPVDFGGCNNLAQHHGDVAGTGAIVRNTCNGCGFFAPTIEEWEKWDGIVRMQSTTNQSLPLDEQCAATVMEITQCDLTTARMAIARTQRESQTIESDYDEFLAAVLNRITNGDEQSPDEQPQDEEEQTYEDNFDRSRHLRRVEFEANTFTPSIDGTDLLLRGHYQGTLRMPEGTEDHTADFDIQAGNDVGFVGQGRDLFNSNEFDLHGGYVADMCSLWLVMQFVDIPAAVMCTGTVVRSSSPHEVTLVGTWFTASGSGNFEFVKMA